MIVSWENANYEIQDKNCLNYGLNELLCCREMVMHWKKKKNGIGQILGCSTDNSIDGQKLLLLLYIEKKNGLVLLF